MKIGTYNPIASKDGIKEITADSERVKYWLSVGAQLSDKVAWIFGKVGLIPAPPIRNSTNYTSPKSMKKKSQV